MNPFAVLLAMLACGSVVGVMLTWNDLHWTVHPLVILMVGFCLGRLARRWTDARDARHDRD